MRYRKRPVEVDAWQWNGQPALEWPEWILNDPQDSVETSGMGLCIYTLEGAMIAEPGDWIIRGIKGELYPVKPDVFEQTYVLVEV